MTKIKAVKIEFQQEEGLIDHWTTKKATFENCNLWTEVDRYINKLCCEAQRQNEKYGLHGVSYKSRFVVYFEDGFIWSGHSYGIDPENSDGGLGDYINEYFKLHSGMHKPSHWTEEQYKSYLNFIFEGKWEKQKEEKEIYDTYQFGD